MTSQSKKKAARLKESIEIVRATAHPHDDTLDHDIAAFIDDFLTHLPAAVKLEEFSIATPEAARHALGVIDDTLHRLNKQMATAQALKKLALESDKR